MVVAGNWSEQSLARETAAAHAELLDTRHATTETSRGLFCNSTAYRI